MADDKKSRIKIEDLPRAEETEHELTSEESQAIKGGAAHVTAGHGATQRNSPPEDAAPTGNAFLDTIEKLLGNDPFASGEESSKD